ncbi:hypothetical protein [Promicromonospora soli]
MRENPRPTRHLEHVEPELFGEPVPGSISGPAWDLVPLPGSPDPPVVGEPTPSGDTAGPAAPSVAGWPPPPGDVWSARSAEAASATSGDVWSAPSDDVWPPPSAEVEPAPSSERSWKRPAIVVGGVVVAVLALGIGGLALLGQLRPDDADTTPAVELADLELPITIPQDLPSAGPSGPSRSVGSEPRRSEAPETGSGAILSPPGETGTQPVPGGTGEGGADTGTGPGTGGSTGGDTGSSGGGSATPTPTAPPPTSTPTSGPTSKPTPRPTPSASGEPTPDPTPTPSVSPTPEPTDAPVSPGTGP